MRIAVIDDEMQAIERVVQLIRLQPTAQTTIPTTIRTFISGEQFLLENPGANYFDVIFMDIEMPKINGLDLGVKIRENDPQVILVYFTNYPEYALEAYEAHPYAYLCKPLNEVKFAQVWLKICTQVVHRQSDFLTLETKACTMKIPLADILYIESFNHAQIIHREHGTDMRSSKSLSYFETVLDDRFYRLHKSYLVNLEKIERIDQHNHQVMLKNGVLLPVRKNNLAALNARYVQVLQERSVVV